MLNNQQDLRCSDVDKLSKQETTGSREVSTNVDLFERLSNNALFTKHDKLNRNVKCGSPEDLKKLKEDHPLLYSGLMCDMMDLNERIFFKTNSNTECWDLFVYLLSILKEIVDCQPEKLDNCAILADTFHQHFDNVNKASKDFRFEYNFYPDKFKVEDVDLVKLHNPQDDDDDSTIPMMNVNPSYWRDKFSKFEVYKEVFGENGTYFEDCIHAHIHLAVRLSECKSITSFFFHICDYFKDIVGISYGEFIRDYERFIVVFMGTCFGVSLIYNTIPREKRKSERTHMPVVQSGDSVSKYNFRRFLEQMKMFIRNKQRVMDSDFVNKFGNFCSLILCTPFCVKMGIDHTLFGYSDYYSRKMQYKYREKHILGVSFEILEGSIYILDKITLYVETGDLSAFFIDDEEIAKYETKYLQLTEFKELPSAMANFGWSVDDYYRECDKCIEQGKRLQHFYGHDKVKLSTLKVQQSMLARYKMKAYVKLQVESKREPPLGFCLYGSPSVGKSALIDKLCHCMYENAKHIRGEGRKYDPSVKYMYNEDDEYFSEFKISKEVCVIDDVDQFKDDINLMKKGGGMAKGIYLVNPIPYITNQAALEDKGMIPFMCKYVIATTNTYDAGISKIFRKHGGAYRRFYFIEIVVKPEYRAPNSTQLRGDLSEEGFKNHELHFFKFRKYISQGNDSSAYYWNKDTNSFVPSSNVPEMSFKELSILLYHEVQVPHYRQNDATEKSVNDFLSKDFCDKCCSVFCDCAEPQSGMTPNPVPLLVYNNWYLWGALVMFFLLFYIVSLFIGYSVASYNNSHKYKEYFLDKLIGSYHFCWCRAIPNPMRNYVLRDYITLWLERQVRLVYKCGLLQHLHNYSVKVRRKRYQIAAFASLVAVASMIYKGYKSMEPRVQSSDTKENINPNVVAKSNSWKVTYQDLSKVSGPPSTTTIDKLSTRLEHNVVRLVCDTIDGLIYTNGFGYRGNLLYVPKHWIVKLGQYGWPRKIDVIREPIDNSVGRSRFGINIDMSNILDPDFGDMLIIRHSSFGTFRDVSKFVLDDFLPGKMKGHILIRNENGHVERNPVHGVGVSMVSYKSDNKNYKYVGYSGYVEKQTKSGDCGAPYLVETINGVFIAGFHVAAVVQDGAYRTRVLCCPFAKLDLSNTFVPASYNGLDLSNTYNSKENLEVKPVQHVKCPIRDTEGNEVAIYGSIDYPRRKMKSTVCETLMCKDVLDHYDLLEPLHTSPKGISSRKAAINNLRPMFRKRDIPQRYVNMAIDSIYEWFRREIHALGGMPSGPLSLAEAINGIDDVAYMDRMPVKTSGGFGHKGAKLKHFVELEPTPEHAVRYGFDNALQHEYDIMLARYKECERGQVIWDFNFKDEPVTHDKVVKQKCRIFNSGPCAFIALERQYFLWCVPFLSGKHRHLFGSAIGANVFGTDWATIYHHITRHGINRMIAGDYKHFDKSMHAQMSLGAFDILIKLMRDAGWPEEDITVAMGIATDVCYPMSNAFGTIIEVEGSNPSGHSLTTIINCIVNIMYIQIAVMHIEEERGDAIIDYSNFLDYVSLITYGDDNVMSTAYDWINHVDIAEVLERYEVVYTMADKESQLIPFTPIEDIDFLKRKFIPGLHGEGTVGAPLAEESIIKMLTVVTKSNSIHFEQQCAEVISAANREYFQYGKEVCNAKKQFLDGLVDKYNLRPYLNNCTLLDYEAIFLDIYNDGPSMSEDSEPLREVTATAQSGFSWIHPEETEMSLNLVEYSFAVKPLVIRTNMIEIKPKKGFLPAPILSNCCIGRRECVCEHCHYHNPDSTIIRQNMENVDSVDEQASNSHIEVQSGEDLHIEVSDTTNEVEQNVEFTDAVPQYDLMIGERVLDETYLMAKVGAADDLQKFLERPVRIFNKFWEVGESPAYINAIKPWSLFLNNDRVKNKLETFKLLNGVLHIKMLINGSPFHYGRMLVGCRPSLYDNNQTPAGPTVPQPIFPYVDNAGAARTLFGTRTLYSSRPHVYLDPSTNQPQHISWPFFSPGNYIDLNEPETVERMGVLEIWELNQLKHANGATDGVEITMFAWMSNAKLAGLTAKPVEVQSGMKVSKKGKTIFKNSNQDEHKPNGLISAPASTLANFSNHFVNIPYIGSFAKATNIAANAVGGIAKIFGYSRPVILTDTNFYRTQPLGNLSNYSGSDPLHKLSLDPKQELTIDPATVGLTSEDQMSFAYLSKREAWIDTVPWNLPNDVLQSQGKIYSILVHPMVAPIFNVQSSPIIRCFAQTPVSFVTRPFEFWTGSLRYRFQIVCSQFHRGRLMFVYEPDLLAGTDENDVNNRFSHIIDIAEERDVTFEVNWTQENAFRRTDAYGLQGAGTIYTRLGDSTTGGFSLQDRMKSNGKLEIYVLNQLAAPTDAADVEINVFISAGDSFEVKAPGKISQWSYMNSTMDPVGPPAIAQSGFLEVVTDNENCPEQDTMYVLNGNPKMLDLQQSQVYFGETIISFRSLLKRYCFHRCLLAGLNAPTTSNILYLTQYITNTLPVGPGKAYGSSTVGNITATTTGLYNICAFTYIRYIMSAYIGYRGSIRWKVAYYGLTQNEVSLRVARTTDDKFELVTRDSVISGTSSRSQVAQRFLQASTYSFNQCGSMATTGSVMPTLEYEIPFYHNYRFADCNIGPTNTTNPFRDPTHVVTVTNRQDTEDEFGWLETNCATGEDFSLFFFIGAPVLVLSDVATVTPSPSN